MTSCTIPSHSLATFPVAEQPLSAQNDTGRLILGGGCFWCTEAVFLQLEGVDSVISGYAGGHPSQANYDSVCTGVSGHAEVIEIRYQPNVIRYSDLLRLFFAVAHDPTQLNRQGNDRGTQYRSAIFYETSAQKDAAERYISQLDQASVFTAPIVTTLEPLTEFFTAEQYHQNYAQRNPGQPYIQFAAMPKVEKLKSNFAALLKDPK
ncbi:MAG: peptide-methionine (S)-S-oxide reductase MsrA [Alcanivoracaceae bacterium]|nr:peptide-methionine (S)-S-oxide reductase MsrA [Alcanivoracaceae bacterium]